MNSKLLKVYAVTDRSWLHGHSLEDVVSEVLEGGATILQLREKELSQADFLAEGHRLKRLCEAQGIPLIINDNVAIAKELGVGAHVGQSDLSLQEARHELGPEAIIGVSCQTVAQAIQAEKHGADYLGVGAVFPTETKKDADAVDERELAAICAAVNIPVVAIGGINHGNVLKLSGSGIAGVAVVSALFAAKDPRQATKELSLLVEHTLNVPVPQHRGAIIDLDGTILDSMPYWDRLATDYLATKGKVAFPNLRNLLNTMELPEGSRYLKETYHLNETPETIQKELIATIQQVYAEKALLFPEAHDFLQKLHHDGVRLALFSASAHESLIASLKRNHVLDLFDTVISTLDIGLEKSSPEAYYHVLGRLGTTLSQTTIYEDAPYALAGARQTGMKTIAVTH